MVTFAHVLLLAASDAAPCGAMPIASDATAARYHDDDTPRRATVYLNFSGGYLGHPIQQLAGGDNSAENISVLVPFEGLDVPPYVGDEQTAIAVAQAVEADYSPYGVRVLYLERPPARLPYTMVMMGGSASLLELDYPYGGVAPIDCTVDSMRHVVYAFNGEGDVADQANIVTHEIAHAWGLDHTLGDEDVMSYSGSGLDKSLLSGCRDYCTTACLDGFIACTERHEEYCPPGQQDAVAELTHIFGGDAPDIEAPEAIFLAPEDGEIIDEGEGIAIEAEISDDFGNFGWSLRVEHDGAVVYDEPDYSGIPKWYVSAPAAGTWAITLEVEDHAGHVTTESVTVEVRAHEAADTGDAEGSTGAATSIADDDTGSSGSDDDASSGGDTSSGGASSEEAGCGCRGNGRSQPLVGLLALAGAGRRRRRALFIAKQV